MFKVEVIGNLGADAVVKNENGRDYVQFRVAHTDKFIDRQTGVVREITTWVSCFMNGRPDGLLPYLTTGTKIFIRGFASFNVYSSPKTKQMEAGVSCNVTEVELCGGMNRQEKSACDEARTILHKLEELGYDSLDDIPPCKSKKK